MATKHPDSAPRLGGVLISNQVVAELLEQLLAKGITPSILKSVNYPPNVEFNNQLYKRYDEEGV